MSTYYAKVQVNITIQSQEPLSYEELSTLQSNMYTNIEYLRSRGLLSDEIGSETNEVYTKMFNVEVENVTSLFYVNCRDRYGYYLMAVCGTKKEAEESAALWNSMYAPARKFEVSTFSAPQLTADMMQNPQDYQREGYFIQRYDPALGSYEDFSELFHDKDDALSELKRIDENSKYVKWRAVYVSDTMLHNQVVGRTYHKVHLPDSAIE